MKKERIYVISSIAFLYTLVTVLFAINPIGNLSYFFIHLFALYGLTSLCVATILTAFQKQLFRIFGRPFIQIHHIFSISGIVLLTIHPTIYAVQEGWRVFLPDFSSNFIFWYLAGRPALILIYIALIAVLLKKLIARYWRVFHWLNYIALVFGLVHGIMIGESLENFNVIEPHKLILTTLFLVQQEW